ncbi:hypothetical protein LTR53_018546, partial [Teratosphaeriaceae sp. CCFEE 6253]
PPPPPHPDFDLSSATLLCRITDQAMQGMSDEELRQHVARLGAENGIASEVLSYWAQRKDEGLREKEALEGVVGNLVGFVK